MTKNLKAALPADLWFNDNKDALTIKDGLAWKGAKLYVPTSLRLQILQHSHDSKLDILAT